MSTQPPSASAPGVYEISDKGFAKGTNAYYDLHRPTYPSATLHRISHALSPTPSSALPPSAAHADSQPGYLLLEPGSGTGIMSRLLLLPPGPEYPSIPIRKLVGIEPSQGMREQWASGMKKLGEEASARAEVREGTFGDYGFGSESTSGQAREGQAEADGVIIAQAWHWCPDYDQALREAARHLRPGAPLILVWNLESSSPAHFSSAIQPLLRQYDRDSPQYARGRWRACFDTPAYAELFDKDRYEEFHDPWVQEHDEQGLVDRLMSNSYLTEEYLKGEEREKFVSKLRDLIRQGHKEWTDEEKGVFKYHYVTDTYVLRKKADAV